MSETDDTSVRAKYEQRILDYVATARHYDAAAAECHTNGTVRDPTPDLTEAEQRYVGGMQQFIDGTETWYDAHQAVAVEYRDYVRYVEGFVASAGVVVPIQHAWVEFTETDHLVDLTLPAPLNDERTVTYVGKAFSPDYLSEFIFETAPDSGPILGHSTRWPSDGIE